MSARSTNAAQPAVVIFTDEIWSPVSKRIVAHLEDLGVPVMLLDEVTVKTLSVFLDGGDLRVYLDDREIAEPLAVLRLRLPIPPVPDEVSIDARRFHNAQWWKMLSGLQLAWAEKGIPMVNSPVYGALDDKTAQLIRAANVGFATPETVHTASVAPLDRFTEPKDLVAIKPFAPFVRLTNGDGPYQRLLTNVVDLEELTDGLRTSRVPAPTIVQHVVNATREHRIVVVDQQVFGASASRDGLDGIDMRRPAVTDIGAEASELPDAVRAQCIKLVEQSGLAMAVLDVLETQPDIDAGNASDWVFLELNPMGHFLWVEQLTNQPICRAIALLLAKEALGESHLTTTR